MPSEHLAQAIADLHINVPIYRITETDTDLTLYLYGGRIEHWPIPKIAPDPDTPEQIPGATITPTGDEISPDPGAIQRLTAIPGVGPATAAQLYAAGFRTLFDLLAAADTDLLNVPKVNALTVSKIRAYATPPENQN